MNARFLRALFLTTCLATPAVASSSAQPARQTAARDASRHDPPAARHAHGKKQRGKASFYSHRLAGKKMADGTHFNPASNAAASKTLPLGTQARVRNLHTGKTAVVQIRDRGPHVKGRIVDLSPRTAEQLGMKARGVAMVEVEPLTFPEEGGKGVRRSR